MEGNGCGSTNAEPGRSDPQCRTGSAAERSDRVRVGYSQPPCASVLLVCGIQRGPGRCAPLRSRFCILTYFLKSFANASRAPDGGPEEVWRSTTIRVANSSQVLRACLSTIRARIVLLHSRRAPGSK